MAAILTFKSILLSTVNSIFSFLPRAAAQLRFHAFESEVVMNVKEDQPLAATSGSKFLSASSF